MKHSSGVPTQQNQGGETQKRVSYLVSPAAETTSGVDVLSLEFRKKLLENTLTLQGWSGVTVVKAAVVGRDNLIIWSDHLSVDETLDRVPRDVGLVNWFHGGF